MNENKNDPALHENLHRGLRSRHIQLIALGGCIGVGLFLGSATSINAAGPSVILAYLVVGIAIYFVMRALGEVSIAHPVSGAFSAHAAHFLGPVWGYITGLTYVFMWIVTCMAELTAVGIYMNHWFPDLPQWVSALVALGLMTAVNFIAVSAYGEFEFWFALLKVGTIIAMIVVGTLMILFGWGNAGHPTGISNLWAHGGFFPHGISGTVLALVMVTFSFIGIEIVGVTAGEAADPEKSLRKAIDQVFWRIILFYVLSMFVILSIYPWDGIGTMGSPFVTTFEKLGIAGAADFINVVVITAVLSSCNTGIFSNGRMLYNLALQGHAPKMFARLNHKRLPAAAIAFSSAVLLLAVVLNYILPEKAFVYVTSIGSFGAVFTWFVILLCQYKYRRSLTPEQVAKLPYRVPGAPWTGWITMAFLVFIVAAACMDADTRIAVYVTPAWFAILLFFYWNGQRRRRRAQQEMLEELRRP